MKGILSLASVFLFLVCCVHTTPAKEALLGPQEITVWSLQALAQNGRTDVLNELFNNHGITLEKLPAGSAAGAGVRASGMKNPLFSRLMDDLTGPNWRGKIFFPSEDPRRSRGLNRIKQTQRKESAVTPMGSFVSMLVDRHPLVPEAKSNLVILNYAQPLTQNYWQELVLTQMQIYEVMVAVPGKFGPIFIGKTWFGKYAENRTFTAADAGELTAWFFLDFNAPSLSVQQGEPYMSELK